LYAPEILKVLNNAECCCIIGVIVSRDPFSFIVPADNAFSFPAPIAGGNNTSMAENYYLFFKPLPVGDHTINVEVIRQPLQANQPMMLPNGMSR
jgi:hypothetical protein